MLRQKLLKERGIGSRSRFDRAVSSERLAGRPGVMGFQCAGSMRGWKKDAVSWDFSKIRE
jgi:hypothetical protein